MNSVNAKKEFIFEPIEITAYCSCGRPHPDIQIQKYVGQDAYDILTVDAQVRLKGGRSALILDDQNTHAVAGAEISEKFHLQRLRFQTMTLPGDVSATDSQADAVMANTHGHELIVAVGSGTINDLAKYAAGQQHKPYWCVPTAPSMNGYTSSIAAIKKAGVKRTLASPPPQFVYIRPDVICSAPLRLRQAGFCDVMAKSVSDIDWQMESLLFSGTYCRLPSRMVSDLESDYREFPDLIREGQQDAVTALLNGLLVSGVAMSVAGSSAPASGGEHLVSHFLDMRETFTGRRPELHGLQVALGIVLSAACYEALATLNIADLSADKSKIVNEDVKLIPQVWKKMTPEIEKRYCKKRDLLMQLHDKLRNQWEQIHALSLEVAPAADYVKMMRQTGFALTLDALHVPEAEFLLAARMARTIRERITVLDIAAQAGVLEKAATRVLKLIKA
jgi:glycerol-1-phosphate dehydrogenase [NAD(P)+]